MTTTAQEIEQAYPNTKNWAWKIVEVADRLDVDPSWLANIMSSESNHRPQALNDYRPRDESGEFLSPSYAVGLIQFIPSTAKSVLKKYTGDNYSSSRGSGTMVSKWGHTLSQATQKIYSMNALEQMELVYHYLADKGALKSQNDVVLAVFYPIALGKGDDFNIADHYAYKDGQYPRGSDGYNRRYQYLKTINGGIEYAKDYSNLLSSKWKLEPKERSGLSTFKKIAILSSIATSIALLLG